MGTPGANQAAVPDSWAISIEGIKQRVEEHYEPWEPGEESWYLCQRSGDNGAICGRKCFFPHGIIAHENHHSIESGNEPLIDQSQPDDGTPSGSDGTTPGDTETDGELLESIQSDFEL